MFKGQVSDPFRLSGGSRISVKDVDITRIASTTRRRSSQVTYPELYDRRCRLQGRLLSWEGCLFVV